MRCTLKIYHLMLLNCYVIFHVFFFFCRNSYQLYSRYPVARHTRNHHMYFTIYSRQLSFFCDIILWSVIEQLVTVKLFNMS